MAFIETSTKNDNTTIPQMNFIKSHVNKYKTSNVFKYFRIITNMF